jgi:hypothetical protein
MLMEVDHFDMEHQRAMVTAERREAHTRWMQKHSINQRFNLETSRIRARILVDEAYRQEKAHLAHQYAYVKQLLGNKSAVPPSATMPQKRSPLTATTAQTNFFSPAKGNVYYQPDGMSSPHRGRCNCACIRAPTYRLLTPKFRAMNLLKAHYDPVKLEAAVDALMDTYCDDHAMMLDLTARFGPDPPPDPALWLRSVQERMEKIDEKWRGIGAAVASEMHNTDAFPIVIRNLSIMRIFLEGSQAAGYGCDVMERARRDAVHQRLLERLSEQGALFVRPSK